jgi:hypothetical protein
MTDDDMPAAGETPCTTCAGRVRWHVTVGGKVIALDSDPVEDGNIIVVAHEGRVRARVLEGTEMPAQQTAYRRHRCPPLPVGNQPRCTECYLPMDAELARSEKWSTHPTCDPEYKDDLRQLLKAIALKGVKRRRRK